MKNLEDDTVYFRRCCTLTGRLVSLSIAKRNGKPFLSLPRGCAELADRSEERPFWTQERYYVNLNPIERRTWEKVLRGYTISQIAREEGVSRQAILARIRGNSKDQGGMVSKNFWVLLFWVLRRRINGYEKND
jgi:hypothetical protein